MQNENQKFKDEFKRRLYSLILRLIKWIDDLPRNSVSDVMGKQLLRSGTSVLANFIEAKAASSRKDFVNFFTYSLKSANESKMWLTLLRDTNKGNRNELEFLLREMVEISNVIATSIMTLKNKKSFYNFKLLF